jgi:hypothetical protein
VVYAYAAVITMAVTVMVVVFPIWQRGGREAVVDDWPTLHDRVVACPAA